MCGGGGGWGGGGGGGTDKRGSYFQCQFLERGCFIVREGIHVWKGVHDCLEMEW